MINSDYKERQQAEVDSNFEAFQKQLDTIHSSKYGKFALMKTGEIKSYFDTWKDARTAGELAYEDRLFSIQKVTNDIVDLGYYSHAFA